MNSVSCRWVAAFAVAIGLTSIANARTPAAQRANRTCVGEIVGTFAGYAVGKCSFVGTTPGGKRILAVCPEGSRCRVAASGKWVYSEVDEADLNKRAWIFHIKKIHSVRRI